ncbi:MAG TPA: hypothetical protein VMF14_09855 [Solirubrobacteraceae bacterium]|nr:hypothetical protein [Solirubrobacteraceae bacterium]
MSHFEVTPGSVGDAGSRLQGIAGQVLSAHGAIAGCSGAAAGTPGADAFDGLMGHWAAVLPHFALSGAALSGALGGAASSYSATDVGIAVAADGGGKR